MKRVMRPLNLYLRTITVPSLDWVVVTQTSSSPTLRYSMTYHLPKLLLRPVATTQCGHKWIMVISDEKIRQTHHHPPIYTDELLAPSYVSRMPRLTLGKCRTRLSERPDSVCSWLKIQGQFWWVSRHILWVHSVSYRHRHRVMSSFSPLPLVGSEVVSVIISRDARCEAAT